MSSLPFVLLVLLSLSCNVISQRVGPRGFSINCGASRGSEVDGIAWLPDSGYVEEGVSKTLSIPGLHPVLSVLRTFPFNPLEGPRQFCYSLRTIPRIKYLIRTSYFYGGVNGNRDPPVFDLIVDGTFWAVVNTTADYAKNTYSYYEGIYRARGSRIRLCLGGNSYTDSDPFISTIETIILHDSVYNSTDFDQHALGLVARSSFGHSGSIFRHPDDRFNRYWQPFVDQTETITGSPNVSTNDLWNLPPRIIFHSGLIVNGTKPMHLQWPQFSLPNASYYIALYFADPLSENTRALDISINGINFVNNLRVPSSGICIFTSHWFLSGPTTITLAPSPGSNLPALINAGEVFSLVRLRGLTNARDVRALEAIKSSLVNPPPNWAGDPCLPVNFRWAGVTCTENSSVRVVRLNLSNMNLSGSLSPEIGQMTALTEIDLSDNNLSGNIPDLTRLTHLEKLHLQGNNFEGPLPWSLGDLDRLRELFVENNNLSGPIPTMLRRQGLNFRYLPGNNLSP